MYYHISHNHESLLDALHIVSELICDLIMIA